ncbi:uncharacterized protein [Aristolochia californica]|uniref:uncharacterized protein n=1 Tax=Aristolochia californica TaxID=171875 RepID=UPI0035D9FFF7
MMSQEHQGTNSVTPEVLSGKRKRGRPRKDESVDMSGTPGSDVAKRNRCCRVDSADCTDTAFVGQVVSGVLDGSFDAGYLLTVRVGETGTVLRGVVFEPGLSVPISAANDVAPHVKMIRRNEVTIPVSPLNQVPSLAVGQNPSKLVHANEAAHPSEGSPTIWGPKVLKYDGSGPSSVPLNGPSDVTQGAPLEMQSESKTNPKVEILTCTQASEPQVEKENFVESLPAKETCLPSKGADCDINEPAVVTPQTLPSEVKPNASIESVVATFYTNEVPGDSCHVLQSCNQEPSVNSIDIIEVSHENESSDQVEGLSNVELPAMDTQLELVSVPSTVKEHAVGAAIETFDAFKQDNEAMLVDVSANCLSEVPAVAPQGEPLEASDEIQKLDEAPQFTTGPSSDDATVSKEDVELVRKTEIPVEEVDLRQTNLNVTPSNETLQANVTSAVKMSQFNVTSAVELQSDVTPSLDMLDAAPVMQNNPQDEASNVTQEPLLTEAAEDANEELESQKRIDELGSVGGLQKEVTHSAAYDMLNELKQKEPVLLDLMGPAFPNEAVLPTPSREDPAGPAADEGFMELGKVGDQSIGIIIGDIPEDPSETGALPQNG